MGDSSLNFIGLTIRETCLIKNGHFLIMPRQIAFDFWHGCCTKFREKREKFEKKETKDGRLNYEMEYTAGSQQQSFDEYKEKIFQSIYSDESK